MQQRHPAPVGRVQAAPASTIPGSTQHRTSCHPPNGQPEMWTMLPVDWRCCACCMCCQGVSQPPTRGAGLTEATAGVTMTERAWSGVRAAWATHPPQSNPTAAGHCHFLGRRWCMAARLTCTCDNGAGPGFLWRAQQQAACAPQLGGQRFMAGWGYASQLLHDRHM